MINEKARLSYLEAMGIRSWVPREQLPGAKPSIRLVPQGQQPCKERALEGASGLAAMRNALGTAPTAVNKAASTESVSASIDALKASLSIQPTAKSAEEPAAVASTDEAVLAEGVREIPSLSLLSVDDVLLVAEQPIQNGVKGLQYPHRVLLNDALRILSPSFRRENVSEDEIDSQLIQQTLPRTASNHDRWDHIQAILNGFVDVRAPKLVLCFGSDANELLALSSLDIIPAASFDTLFEDAEHRLKLANQLAAHVLS
ncbi:hypothetical protein [uncultured Umboniibacter sp.]|uniref:hypothetical protein n=1 Tax=uncultured Umboniibacter sp. TaxID=1798917 RepID=UPI002602F03D|nr:hypothetical protein [uncultured Umboniibacter sp.]